jgi:hypothetical protein
MQTLHRRAVVAVTLLAVLGIGIAEAKKPRPKRLRQEIAELKAKLAQLESQVQFQTRRLETRLPVVAGGLCTDPCALDSDGDGQGDCADPCPCDPTNADADADGMPDCFDPCPEDATNACIDPCRTDSDGDGENDCVDPCPWDPRPATDEDGDGIPDCQDPCPGDRTNDCITPCPLDADGDGMKDCVDPCPWGAAPGSPCIEPSPTPGGCRPTGCSGQLCAAESVATTCEWRPEYACYQTASCERQPDGACGWTMTDALRACLGGATGG